MALTLPNAVVRGLKHIHPDLAWAIVTLFEKRPHESQNGRHADVELVGIADQRFLIVVNRAVVRRLPGVQIVPFGDNRAFLALAPGQGVTELELAVRDRLEERRTNPAEREALQALQRFLRKWRRDRATRIHSRSIIVVERAKGRSDSIN